MRRFAQCLEPFIHKSLFVFLVVALSAFGLGQADKSTTTTLAVTSPAAPPYVFGQNITFAATVTRNSGNGAVNGSVTFYQTNASGTIISQLGPSNVGLNNNGTATITTNVLAAGSQFVRAYFTPSNSSLDPSSSAPLGLTISKASATITLGNLSHTYNGSPKAATASTNPSGLGTVTITYNGSATAPTNAGSYAVEATLDNPNYQATPATGTLTIEKATATISLDIPFATYDGTQKPATASTTPSLLTGLSITYNGNATAPTNAGSYAVVASLNNQNYQATDATGTLIISKAMQIITFGGPASPQKFGNGPLNLSASSSSGLPVTFTLSAHPDWLTGNTIVFPGTGTSNVTLEVSASQGGNENYFAAIPVVRSLTILENAAPSISADQLPVKNANEWNNTAVTVILTALDNPDGSGIDYVQFSIDGGTPQNGTPDGDGKFNLPAFTNDGVHSITFRAFDLAGNQSSEGSFTVRIDQVSPEGYASGPAFDRTDSQDRGWYRTQRTIQFNGSDDRSGIDGSAVQYLDTVAGGEPGQQSVTADFHDKAGNQGSVIFNYYFDSVAPSITVGGASAGSYQKSISALTVTVNDPFLRTDVGGITLYRRANPDADWQTESFTNGMEITTDGIYRLVVHAEDEAGNQSDEDMQFTVLNSLPTITILSPSIGWHKTDQTLDYNAKNAVLQTIGFMLQTITNLPGSAIATVSGALIDLEGRYELNLTAVDQAGNEASLTHHFEIDKTAPTIVANALGDAGVSPWYVDPDGVQVNLTAADPELKPGVAGSGVQEIRWYATGAGASASQASPNVSPGGATSTLVTANGTTTIHYWAVDAAGNESTPAIIEVKLDNVAPTIDSTSPDLEEDATSRSGKNVSYSAATASDNLPGTVALTYSKESGDLFAIGTTIVTVTAADEAGNTATDTFEVKVKRPVPVLTTVNSSLTTYSPGATTTLTIVGSGIFEDTKVVFDGQEFVVDASSDFTNATVDVPLGNAGDKPVKLSTPASLLGNDGGLSNELILTIAKAPATLTLGNLSFTYDGNAHPVIVTSNPAGLAGITILYNGIATAPTNAGTYPVVASLDNQNYQATDATGDLVIEKAQPTVLAVGGTFTYDGTAKPGSGSAKGVNNEDLVPAATLTYSSGSAPVNAGNYTLTAHFAGNDNYLAGDSSPVSIQIDKAQAMLSLSDLSHTYDGNPKSATVTTDPAGLAGVSVTYGGSTSPPINAGSYEVVAKLDNPNYWANDATCTMAIAKAHVEITLGNLSHVYDGTAKSATATTEPAGHAVTLTYDPPTVINAGPYSVMAVVDEPNFEGTQDGTLTIQKATQTITFTGVPTTATIGQTITLTATGGGSGNPVTFSLNAGAPASLSGNVLTVTGIGPIVVTANQQGNDNYLDASAVSRAINGIHSWSNVLQPINVNGSSVFKLNSTIPVKFRLTGGSSGITNGVFRLYATKISNGVAGTEAEAVSTSAADSGNMFRYSATDDLYIFNLATKPLGEGTWQLRIDLGDGELHTVTISIRK